MMSSFAADLQMKSPRETKIFAWVMGQGVAQLLRPAFSIPALCYSVLSLMQSQVPLAILTTTSR